MARKRVSIGKVVNTQPVIQQTIVDIIKKEESVTPKELAEEIEDIKEEKSESEEQFQSKEELKRDGGK
jgi:hypothetical protein